MDGSHFHLLLAEVGRAAPAWVDVGYLVSAVLFIFGIKGMTHPRTAVRGNLLGSMGMLVAAMITFIRFGELHPVVMLFVVLLAVAIGAAQMPQLVALFNGFGGIASVFVAGAELIKLYNERPKSTGDELTAFIAQHRDSYFAAGLAGLIGIVTFTGSIVAAGKLQELKQFQTPIKFKGQQYANLGLFLLSLGLAVLMLALGIGWPYILLVLIAGTLGVLLVSPIGGADMPVVIALLNSYSGLAAAAAGFVIDNKVLIIAGSLVGASGLILTSIMCKAMNRSLVNVLFGTLQPAEGSATADEVYEGKIKSTSAEEVAMLLDGVQRVVVVPGYGLAVAQAQHTVRELATELEKRDVNVDYAIHPVAGRMPGHMNVLLAEADVHYDKLREMDDINPEFPQVDVAIVIGANDVVNPVADTDPNSPIAGMPILNVHEAKTVIVIKRSLSPGFAGIPNPLFAADNCLMFFGDGKEALQDLVTAVKEM